MQTSWRAQNTNAYVGMYRRPNTVHTATTDSGNVCALPHDANSNHTTTLSTLNKSQTCEVNVPRTIQVAMR
jgi:hypothetical protein